jgi:hypothetical protein
MVDHDQRFPFLFSPTAFARISSVYQGKLTSRKKLISSFRDVLLPGLHRPFKWRWGFGPSTTSI